MITRVMPVRWPATGRWQVRQYLSPYSGPMGTPQVRYAVIGPNGHYVSSSPSWSDAQRVAERHARGWAW